MATGKILLILGSSRKDGDTRRFANSVFKNIEHRCIDLLDLKISYYDYSHAYPGDDQFALLTQAVLSHEKIVFATPVYWYAMSGLMKTVFDRITDLVTYQKETGRQLKGKKVYLLAMGADPQLPPGFEVPFRLTAKYLDMHYKGSVYCSEEILPMTDETEKLKRDFEKLLLA